MSRIAVIVSLLLAAGCDVGSVNAAHNGPDGSNGSPDGSGSGSNPGSNCDAIVATPPTDHHNSGQACLQAGCHLIGNTGPSAPEYSYAGTLYRDATGASVFPGATIEITIGGSTHKLVTGDMGNFQIPPALAAAPTNAAPGNALASGCPLANKPMTGQLVQNGGNCNNCHNLTGTAQAPPVYLQ